MDKPREGVSKMDPWEAEQSLGLFAAGSKSGWLGCWA